MNKSQKSALKDAMQFIDSVVNAGTGSYGELGQANLGEIAVLGIVNLDILTEAFPEVAKEIFAESVADTENKDQILFDFIN